MTPLQAINTGFRKSFTFSGRASRSEFWWLTLLLALPFSAVLLSLTTGLKIPMLRQLGIVRFLAPVLMLPLVAAGVRRNHDAGYDGSCTFVLSAVFFGGFAILALVLLHSAVQPAGQRLPGLAFIFMMVPWLIASAIVLFPATILWLMPSEPTTNKYGPNPSEVIQ